MKFINAIASIGQTIIRNLECFLNPRRITEWLAVDKKIQGITPDVIISAKTEL